MDAYEAVSDWWGGLDFTMSLEGNVYGGGAYNVEVETVGAKVGLGEGTRYKIAGGAYTMQSGQTREGYSDVNGTRSNWEGYYIGKEGQYKVEEFKSAGLVLGGKDNITYDKSLKTGEKTNVVRNQSYNAAAIKVETSESLKEYPRGGLSGIYENMSPTTPTGNNTQFIGLDFGLDVMIGVGFDASFKVGFTNKYVDDNTPF